MTYRTCLPVLISIILIQATVNAQPDSVWARIFNAGGWDECSDIVEKSDGGFVLAGFTLAGEELQEEFYLLETDNTGFHVNDLTIGGAGMDMASSIVMTETGDYLVGGWSSTVSAGEQDMYLAGVSGIGLNEQWHHTYGGASQERCISMIRNNQNEIIMAGYTSSFGEGSGDFWMVCVNQAGDSLWSRTYGSVENDECAAIIQTADGGYVLAGQTSSYGSGDWDFWLVRTDQSGLVLWAKSYGGAERERCYDVVETSDGGFLLAGETRSFGAGGNDAWIVRTNSYGDSLWSHTFGGTADDGFQSICLRSQNGAILGGYTDSFAEHNSDMWMVRVDGNGNRLWDRTFCGRSNLSWDECSVVKATADGGFVLAGYTGYAPGSWQDADFILVKTDADPMEIEHSPSLIPSGFALQVFPNPFNVTSTIGLTVPTNQGMRLSVYNIQGQLIRDVVHGPIGIGTHYLTFDGDGLSSGVYFVNLQGANYNATQKIVLLK